MMSITFLIILGVWSALSIFGQFSSLRWMGWWYDKDQFSLIPSWTFFSNPGANAIHILYRDKLIDGQFTPWKEVELYNPSPWRVVWNPKRRQWRMLGVLQNTLVDLADRSLKMKRLLISFAYLSILTYIMTLPHQNESHSRQFLLARTDGDHTSQGAEVVFLSPLHKC